MHLSRLLIFVLVVLLAGPGWANDEDHNDLLTLPAVKTVHLVSTPMLDICLAGDRLVTVGEAGRIAFSDDQGKSWSQAEVPVSVTLTAVAFPTPVQGWAIGHDGVILHSTDRGNSWQKQLDGNQINGLVLDQIKGLLAQAQAELDAAPEAEREELEIRLENLDYFKRDAEMALREGATRPFMDLWFANEREGIVVGAFGMIFRTDDGGGNWEPMLDRIDNPDGFHYYAITRAGTSLFLVGEVGMVFRSDDNGDSWQRIETPYEGSFFGINADSAGDRILAYGLGGNSVISNDGGSNWAMVDKPKTAALSTATQTKSDSILLISYDGTSLLSTDQGRSFSPVAERFSGTVAMQVLENGDIVLAGLNGIKHWTEVETK